MRESSGKKGRLATITAAATVFAALALLLLTGAPLGSPLASQHEQAQGQFSTFAIATTTIYLNRSQSSGTYVSEWVTLNNSTTLTKLPATLTVVASTCRWVTPENLTQAASPASIFHNVQLHNVTSANDTGNLAAKISGFDVCGGHQYWLNYVYWTYSVYRFAQTGLGVNATMHLGAFSDWPGTTTAPANVSATIGPNAVAQFIVATNLTFTAVLPTPVNGPTTCDATGQICSYEQYTYSTASDTTNVTTSASIVFSAASGLRVTAAYENWTVGYKSASVSANTQIGGFFSATNSAFQGIVVQFWYLWILVALVVIVIALVYHRRR